MNIKLAIGRMSLGDTAGSGLTNALFSSLESEDPNTKRRAKKLMDMHTKRETVRAAENKSLADAVGRTTGGGNRVRVGVDNFASFSTSSSKSRQLLAGAAGPKLDQNASNVLADMQKSYDNKSWVKRMFSAKPTAADVPTDAIKSVTFNRSDLARKATTTTNDLAAFQERARVGLDKPKIPTPGAGSAEAIGKGAIQKSTLSRNLLAFAKKKPLTAAGLAAGAGFLASKLFSSND